VALQKYWMRRYMRLRRHALPFLRQLVMYGTSPVRNVWRCIEHEQPARRDVLDDDGTPSGRTIEVERVGGFAGPTFRPSGASHYGGPSPPRASAPPAL
jgi:hypothetical protein